MKKLEKYIIATTNLYGLIHRNKVLEIYNQQNEEEISLDTLKAFINKNLDELEKEFVYFENGFFIHQAILFTDSVIEMIDEKAGKPYYIPEQEELLKYADDLYFEKNKEYKALVNFVEKYLLEDREEAELVCREIHGMSHVGSGVDKIFDMLNQRDIIFQKDSHMNQFVQKLTRMRNNIRIWENNGFTPNEIFDQFEKSSLNSLPDRAYDSKSKEKIGRNDLCYCGSGKKYKKCCLKKDDEKFNY